MTISVILTLMRILLEVERRINDIGEIENHAYSVVLVNEVLNSNQRIETEYSKKN